MKKILFISYDGMTDPLGQSQVIPYLAGLTKFGYRFTILSCEKPDRYKMYKQNIDELLKSFSIKWIPIPYHKKPAIFSSIYDVMMLKRKARQLHAKEKFDMVHTRAGIPSLVGLWMKKKSGIKFLHDIREFYADSRVDGNMWNLNISIYKFIYNYFKAIEKKEIENCDGMVCLTHSAEKIIKSLAHYKAEIILKVIPCSVDVNMFDPRDADQEKQNLLRKELNINERDFVITYLGSTGGWYLTNETLQFCKRLMKKKDNVKVLFISPQKPASINALAENAGIPSSKIIVRHGVRSEVPALLSISDYSIFFIKPCFSKLSSSPTKLGEIMAMGIPVISNAGVGDVKEIIKKYNAGFVVDDFSEKSFDTVINKILVTKFCKEKIRDGAKDFCELTTAIRDYKIVYDKVLEVAI